MAASGISERVQRITTAKSMDIAEKAKALMRQKEDVVDFSWGEPDFDTPVVVKEACKAALDKGLTHYGASRGVEALREAICEKVKREDALEYSRTDNILITPGAKQAIFYALFALLDAGDEVLIPEPYWLTYRDAVELAGGRLITVACRPEEGFRLDAKELERRITRKTKVLIINNPCNPTGVMLSRDELVSIAKIVEKTGIIVISDEIYSALVFDGRKFVSFASIDGMFKRTIVVNGFSKTYAMTGWRLGYILADKLFIDAINKVHQHIATCAGTFIQYAAVEAVRSCGAEVESMRKEYQQRRDRIVEGITGIGSLSCLKPDATFYCWIDIKKTGCDSEGFAKMILEKAKIASVPGSAYGPAGEGYVRFAFAQPQFRIEEGISRIRRIFS